MNKNKLARGVRGSHHTFGKSSKYKTISTLKYRLREDSATPWEYSHEKFQEHLEKTLIAYNKPA
jgi:tRNA(Ile2) C34 agmatinyltransferase TiaS